MSENTYNKDYFGGITPLREVHAGLEVILSVIGEKNARNFFGRTMMIGLNTAEKVQKQLKKIADKTGNKRIASIAEDYTAMAKNSPVALIAMGELMDAGLESELLPTSTMIDAYKAINLGKYDNMTNDQLMLPVMANAGLNLIREELPIHNSQNTSTEESLAYMFHYNPFNHSILGIINDSTYTASKELSTNGVDERKLDQYAMYQQPEMEQVKM